MAELVYLASPYSCRRAVSRDDRAHLAARAVAWLTEEGIHAFSPVVHGHECSKGFYSTQWNDEAWLLAALLLLTRCDELMILTIPGWETSAGVNAEHAMAEGMGKPISELRCKNYLNRPEGCHEIVEGDPFKRLAK